MKTLLFSTDYEKAGSDPAQIVRTITRSLLPDSFPKWAGVTALSFLAAWSGVALGQVASVGADIIWPANGLMLGFLLRMQPRYWFSYLAGSVLASLVVHEIFPFPLGLTLLFSSGNVIEILIAAILLTRLARQPIDLHDVSFLGAFAFFGVLFPAMFTTVFIEIVQTGFLTPHKLVPLLEYFAGDAVGLAVVTPLVLAAQPEQFAILLRPSRQVETLAIFFGLTLSSIAVFGQKELPIVFLLFPLLVLVAFRMGSLGAALAVFVMAVPAVIFAALRRGPFSPVLTGSLIESIFLLQGFLWVTSFTVQASAAAISGRERMRQELSDAFQEAHINAGVDHGTGLANRRTFDKELAREWRRGLREHFQISLLMIDVDFFKLYNDHYGHLAGDACLRAVADYLAKSPLRASDLVARYGGEEFVLLLPRAGLQGAVIIAEILRQRVIDAALPHIGNIAGIVTISIGVATLQPVDAVSETMLIEMADAALYDAKHDGRNRVCAFAPKQEG